MGAVLNLGLAIDRTGVHPGTKTGAHLVVEIAAPADENTPKTRPPLTVVFVIDVSASMRGPPLDHVIQSVELLIALFEPRDRVGIVAFAQNAHEVMSVRSATPEAKRDARAALHALAPHANTNMEAGLKMALGALPPRKGDERQLVCVLSDGVPNVGLSTPLTLAELVRPIKSRASLWALGYGPHHQEDIMNSLANAGGGRYEYIPEPQVCAFAFGKMLGAQGMIVADGVELLLRPAPGVEIRRFIPKLEGRYGAEGIVLPLPDLFVGGRRLVVAELMLDTPHEPKERWPVISAKLAFRGFGLTDKLAAMNIEQSVAMPVTAAPAEMVDQIYAGVLLARCDEQRAEARHMADRGNFEGAAAVLRKMIESIEHSPVYTAFDGSPLSEACEHLKDELRAMELKPRAEDYKAFRRAQISVSLSARDHSGSSSSTNEVSDPYAQEIMRVVAGDYPVATLEQLSGLESGRTLRLRAEQVLGRGKTADILVQSDDVARFHAKIMAQRGSFFVMDLGSPSGTFLNDRRVETHLLATGDILTLGDAKFRYQERLEEAGELRLMAFTDDGNIYVVEKDQLFVMGSSRACSMVIASPNVGRQHAAIRFKDGAYWLEDYGSEFKTRKKNGAPIRERMKLEDGDEYMLGDFRVRFAFRP